MTERTITDQAGRTWTCTARAAGADDATTQQGRDVVLTCVSPSVPEPVDITVGWQWESMSENGLARLVSQASPVPRK